MRNPGVLSLLALCAALYLPGLWAVPPIDRDEASFAQATRQMLESGDYVVPRFQGAPRLLKPAGIYWLQAAAVKVFGAGDAMGAYWLPSAAGALAAVLGTYLIGRRFFGGRVAFLGAAWLAASALLVTEAHLATPDGVLLACIVAAQGCLAARQSTGAAARGGQPRAFGSPRPPEF